MVTFKKRTNGGIVSIFNGNCIVALLIVIHNLAMSVVAALRTNFAKGKNTRLAAPDDGWISSTS